MPNTSLEEVSKSTRVNAQRLKGTQILTSDEAKWSSLLVLETENGPVMEDLKTLPTSDPMVVMVLGPGGPIEYRDSAGWKREVYEDGTGCVVAGDTEMRIRWNLPSRQPLRMAHIFLPWSTAQRVALELADSDIAHNKSVLEQPHMDQPALRGTVQTLLTAVRSGAPDFFAQTAAQWLALQLLIRDHLSNALPIPHRRVADFRLERVLQYMEANVSEPLSLDVLAREAGISRFHFIGLFRRALGTTPHKHLLELRADVAASMLATGDRSVIEIALACGFQSSSHFASVFKNKYREPPTAYRLRHRQEAITGDARLPGVRFDKLRRSFDDLSSL